MLTFEKNIIPKKLHPYHQKTLFADALPQKGFLGALPDGDRSEVDKNKIAKYAPRVLKSLQIQWARGTKEAKFVKALKRVKKIGFVYEHNNEYFFVKQWRLILQNKFKLVKKYQQNTHLWDSLEKFKVFSNLTQVLLHGNPKKGKLSQNKTRSASFSSNIFRYVPGMVNLKALYLKVDSETPPEILQRLNAMPRVYGKLQAFGINWTQKEGQENQVSFSSFVAKENIRKQLTHLSLENVAEENFVQTFELLSEHCQKLMFISIDFSQNDEKSQVPALQLLKDLHKLEKVHISCRDIVSFLQNFTLPISTRDVSLRFNDRNWGDIYEKAYRDDYSKENEENLRRKLFPFGSMWEKLNNLTCFSVYAKYFPNGLDSILCLLNYVFSDISKLKHFQFQLRDTYDEFDEEEEDYPEIFEVHLEKIFSIPCLFKELQTINLEFPLNSILSFHPDRETTLSKLTLLQLPWNTISDVDTIHNIFHAVPKRTSHAVEFLLDRIIIDSNSDLVNLLETLCHPPKKSYIELTIGIRRLNFNTLSGMLETLVKCMQKTSPIENAHLYVYIANRLYEKGVEVLSFLHEVFPGISFSDDTYDEFEEFSEDEDQYDEIEEGSEVDSDDDDFEN